MVYQNISMNLSALETISPPNISISGSNVFSNIISVANTSTDDLLIFASMFIILVVMYLSLSDKTAFQDFGYDDIRALNIALASSILIGVTMISVGWSENFYSIGVFTSGWLVSFIIILIYENTE